MLGIKILAFGNTISGKDYPPTDSSPFQHSPSRQAEPGKSSTVLLRTGGSTLMLFQARCDVHGLIKAPPMQAGISCFLDTSVSTDAEPIRFGHQGADF